MVICHLVVVQVQLFLFNQRLWSHMSILVVLVVTNISDSDIVILIELRRFRNGLNSPILHSLRGRQHACSVLVLLVFVHVTQRSQQFVVVVIDNICVVGHRNEYHVWTFLNLRQLTVPVKSRGVYFQVCSLLLQPFFCTGVGKLRLTEFRNVASVGQAVLLFFNGINVRRSQTSLVVQVSRAVVNQSRQL